ncbi:MAG: phosphatase PAP2 family protein [Fibrella sp.]|nr:phosphatase PAP2 family protein [Armatimonadota bacterium]
MIRTILQLCADSIAPALLFSVFSEVPIALSSATSQTRNATLGRALRFCVVGCVAIAVPVVLAELGKKYEIWHGHPGFPSGHTTFAASASAVIVTYRGKHWLLLCAPATVVMMCSLVLLRYHTPVEVLGGLVLGAVLATLITRSLMPRE